ncbi:MAG: decaprenyl-phosphate phosphoribosyltransferase [Bacteroidota bacterium]
MKYIKLIRVKQWVKNGFLFIPLFFSGDFFNWALYTDLILGFIAFSFVASAIYILNDYRDIEMDKLHPVKCKRPLASGAVAKPTALILMAVLLIVGFGLSYIVRDKFTFVLLLYFAMNLGYSMGLKNISILDIFIVAIGFVLRVKSGGIITNIPVSEWLMVMVFLLALFIAVAKRRDDILIKMSDGKELRKSIKKYNLEFLNLAMGLVSAIVIVSYLLYTLSDEVIQRFGTYRLYYTTMFVIAGIFRYLQLAIVENNTGSPTELLYKDRFIQVVLFLWLLSFYLIIYFPDINIFK